MLAVFCACEKETSQTVEGQDCLVTINTIGEITSSEKQQLLKKAVSVQHEEEGTSNAHTLVVRKGVLKSCK